MLRLLAATATPTPNVQSCQGNLFQIVCSSIQARLGSQSALGPLAQHLVEGIVLFAIILIGSRLLRHLVIGQLDRSTHDPQLRTLARNVGTVLTWLVAIVGGLVAGGLDATPVFTFGGIFTLAIGLAFQDLFRNVLAGIFILLEKPFRIGDQVDISGQTGVVRTINLRTTELRTGDGRLAVLPNLTAFTGVILNSTAFDQRQYSLTLPVEPEADLAHLMRAARAELAATPAISREPAPTVQPELEADGRRVIAVRYWLDYRTNDAETVSGDLLSRLWVATATGVQSGGTPPAEDQSAG